MTPALSAVVCTHDRSARVLDTVRSILASDAGELELLVIDQSANGTVEERLATLADPRVRHVRTETRGLSIARNLGLRLAASPIVALTDDDCEVDRSWAGEIRRAFEQESHIAVVFGNVLPGPVDISDGFIPSYERVAPFLARRLADKADVEGIGACMAVRRQAAIDLGGFDELLGAGSRFRAGEDVDLTLRALVAGHWVFETPHIRVVHHGFRRWADADALVHSYWLGAGAALGKHVRCHPVHGLRLLAQLGIRFVIGPSTVAASLGPKGMPRARLAAFVKGLAAGATLPVDRALGLFGPTAGTHLGTAPRGARDPD